MALFTQLPVQIEHGQAAARDCQPRSRWTTVDGRFAPHKGLQPPRGISVASSKAQSVGCDGGKYGSLHRW